MRVTLIAKKRRPQRRVEGSLSKAIQDSLTLKGARVIRIQSGQLQVVSGARRYFVHLAPKGTPDLLVIVPARSGEREGTHYWLEVKRSNGRPSKEQAEWGLWAKNNGVRHATVRSVGEAISACFGSEKVRVA